MGLRARFFADSRFWDGLFGERLVFRSEALTFRAAEGALLDVDDQAVALPEGAPIRLAHRLDLTGAEVRRWGQYLADHELIQPFEQIGRATTAVHERDLAPRGWVLPVALFGRLRTMGWRRVSVEDAGMVYESARIFPGRGVRVRATHGGIHAGNPGWSDDPVGIEGVSFEDLAGIRIEQAAVDPIVFSEVVRDLERMVD